MAFAAVERIDDVWLHVDQQHAAAGLGEGRGERDADVAGADHGEVVVRLAGHGGQAYRAAAMRPAAWPSPYSGGAPAGNRASASAAASSLGSARRFAPAATVSTHSVLGRSVTQGTRQPVRLLLQAARVGDDGLCAGDEREHLEVAERLDHSNVAASAMACSSRT